jgi:DNA polymerase elongation subunit (family B)
MILRGKEEREVHSFIRKRLFSLLIGNVKMEDMVIRRSLSNSYKIPSNPQLVFANRLRDRGEMVEPGSRLEFVFVKRPKARLQGEKMELADDTKLENLDIQYYLEKHVAPPLDDLLSTAGMNTFVAQFNEYMKYLS